MYDAFLVRHCAPTLAGLKTGSLFSCPFDHKEDMRICLLRWNRQLTNQGIRALPLHSRRGRTLIYIYRPLALLHDLEQPQTAQLLTELNYPLPCPQRCIAHLMAKLKLSPAFPHEIGLFLGYPPEDVLGFIHDPSACKFSGCWKVYGDVPAAQARFAAYRKCTRTCCSLLTRGFSLAQLASHNVFDDVI